MSLRFTNQSVVKISSWHADFFQIPYFLEHLLLLTDIQLSISISFFIVCLEIGANLRWAESQNGWK